MATISQQYEYAKLAGAAYIDFSGVVYTDGSQIARAAGGIQHVIPQALAEQLFDKDSAAARGQPVWTILGAPQNNDAAGFHAALFGRGTEKVLAIAGTEPSVDGQIRLDLLHADAAEIGGWGAALSQAVSMFNYVQRLLAAPGQIAVPQLRLTIVPIEEMVPPGMQSVDIGVGRVYLEQNFGGLGLGGLNSDDRIIVAGHSLGGHLAAYALRLFPDLFGEAYTYNTPGFDPATSLQLADEFVSLFAPFLSTPPAASFEGLNIVTLRSDDLAPGNPALVSSRNIPPARSAM